MGDETNQKENDGFVNAADVNTFFESLPLDFDWSAFDKIGQVIKKEQDLRELEKKQMNEKAREDFSKKILTMEVRESDEEKKLNNEKYLRFLTTDCWMKKDGKKKNLVVRNCFFRADNGKVQIYGRDKKSTREFKMQGAFKKDGTILLQLIYQEVKDPLEIKGKIVVKESVIFIKGANESFKIRISLDVDYWFGYYEDNDGPNDMPAFFKEVGPSFIGISFDKDGLALWTGKNKQLSWEMQKNYIGQSPIDFVGKIQEKRTGRSVNGRWKITNDNEGDFYLCQNADDIFGESDESFMSNNDSGNPFKDGSDEEESKANKEDSLNIEKCPQGHLLIWFDQSDNDFFCDNCHRNFPKRCPAWKCKECDYDICPICRKIPEEKAHHCSEGHELIWNNQQGHYPAPSYICNICNRSGRIPRGRWKCEDCEYDLCGRCRELA